MTVCPRQVDSLNAPTSPIPCVGSALPAGSRRRAGFPRTRRRSTKRKCA
jgi:hypothetical protein